MSEPEALQQWCQHRRIDNGTKQCKECGAPMVAQSWSAETIRSAPNLAGCANPACKQALGDGTYDDANPPAGCTNAHGFYVPDRNRERTITIGYWVSYECDRCEHGPGTLITHDLIVHDCGQSHEGEYVPAAEADQ